MRYKACTSVESDSSVSSKPVRRAIMDKDLKNRNDGYAEKEIQLQKLGTDPNYRHEYIPHVVLIFALLNFGGLIGLYHFLFRAKWVTLVWAFIQGFLSGQGVVLGSHRGYSHKSYKATKLLQYLLIFFHTMSGQQYVYWWARDHRLHHKFSDTDADPYNATRGFWFAHMGWLMMRKHPLVAEKGRTIDVTDLEQDKLVMFQKKYVIVLHLIITFMIPVLVPVYFWRENFWTSMFINYFMKVACVLNFTATVNSFAHAYGTRPIDKRIRPSQSAIADWLTAGDGWHNYHHCFPWDCGMSEFGYSKGLSTRLLDLLEWCGLAYDLKRASRSIVLGHARRHGDGTLPRVDDDS